MKSAMMAKPDTKGLVSGSSRVKVSLYGRVNTMVRYGSTGSESAFQALDNTHSGSRLGVKAAGSLNKNLKATANIELGANGANRAGSDLDSFSAAGVSLRVSEVSLSHKDMGTVAVGHGWRAGSGAMVGSFAGTGHIFGIWGPGGDGILKGKRLGAGSITAFGAREARMLYRTPNLMGVSLEGSYNQDKGWSAGGSLSGLPGVKAIGLVLNAGYHAIPKSDDSMAQTSLGVSGGLKHNASGVNANGSWGQQSVKGGAKTTAWMVDGGWSGKVTDAGNTTISVGYGQWSDGMYGRTTRYHLAINQNIASAGTNLYFGVSHDTGPYTHKVANKNLQTHTLSADGTTQPDIDYTSGPSTSTYSYDMACGPPDETGSPTQAEREAYAASSCAVKRDGVITIIAGVLIVF